MIDGTTISQKQIKLAVIAGSVMGAVILALTGLVFMVAFLVHLAWSLLLQACSFADGQSILTQILLLMVITWAMYQVIKYSARWGRAFFRKGA